MKTPTLSDIATLPKNTGKYPGSMRITQAESVTILDVASSPGSRLVVDQYGTGIYLITPIVPPKGILSKLPDTPMGRKLIEKY
jgi:hypothetical protein